MARQLTPEIPGYRFLEALGSGSSGTVWRAEQTSLRRAVAVKVLAPGLFGAVETRARFLREAKLQAQLAHPNLLGVFDAGFAGAHAYLVMELASGGSLCELLAARGALPAARALELAAQICAGLGCAHDAGVAHRDLKPENVLLTPDGTAKLADFGLAKSFESEGTLRTAEGVLMGTPGYMAPEAIQGSRAGSAADVYAVGVMLFEMLAGRRPFEGGRVSDILQEQLTGTAPRLSELVPSVPIQVQTLVERCLEREPGRRPEFAHLLAERLAVLAREPAAGSGAPTVVTRLSPGPGAREDQIQDAA
ncbi:MAG: serine/threonine protein kinase [Candidatus Wallbacteria bacterium]|nr:serine/threonine protein kinase [Candidatus Wallbacteria bacterium]